MWATLSIVHRKKVYEHLYLYCILTLVWMYYMHSRHYKQCQCRIFMQYTCVYSNWMDCFECDGFHDENIIEKLWTVSCKLDSLRENPYAISCANKRQLYLLFTLMCQSICNLIQSIKKSNLMWTINCLEIWTHCFKEKKGISHTNHLCALLTVKLFVFVQFQRVIASVLNKIKKCWTDS